MPESNFLANLRPNPNGLGMLPVCEHLQHRLWQKHHLNFRVSAPGGQLASVKQIQGGGRADRHRVERAWRGRGDGADSIACHTAITYAPCQAGKPNTALLGSAPALRQAQVQADPLGPSQVNVCFLTSRRPASASLAAKDPAVAIGTRES